MKVGQLVVILLLVGFVALAGKMLFADKPQGNMQAGYTPPRQTQPFSRADDPTYAEEVKGFIAGDAKYPRSELERIAQLGQIFKRSHKSL